MLRAIFFSIGLFVGLWGVSLLVVDKMVLMEMGRKKSTVAVADGEQAVTADDLIDPPDWVAFSVMSVGTVTMLYSVALPRR